MIKNKNTGEKEQAHAKISDLEAEEMNVYANEYKIRYVLADSNKESIKDVYLREVGKKPYGGWDDAKIAEKLEEFRNSQ